MPIEMKRGGSERIRDEDATEREAAQWEDLRELLIAPEKRQLEQVLDRLDNPVRRAEDLSHSLPDAITIGISRDERIAEALEPTIDAALKRSARKDPKALADAIFPALGPAIRKAISAALMGMIQSLNHLLNQSFSFKGLKWRIEALRAGKPFAEVVLLHTLVYRVEQILLIHRQSGILLQHVGDAQVEKKDPDLVSGMLTAIQEFVRDSFDAETGEVLDTLRMDGDHSVWIEQGAHAIIAAVIRGVPPLTLRKGFQDLLDHIHLLCGDQLSDFQGQTAPFALIRPDLEEALTFQARQTATPGFLVIGLTAVAVLVGVALWSWHAFVVHRQWTTLVARLRAQRGIVVTLAEKQGGHYLIAGLKDPLAGNVAAIIAKSHLDPASIQTRWQPYYALDASSILRRARLILKPPPEVALEFSGGTLKISGKVSHHWVRWFRQRAVNLPGVERVDDAELQDTEMNALRTAVGDLNRETIFFKLGQWWIDKSQASVLASVVGILARIQALDRSMGAVTRIIIIGKTDPLGRWAFNLQLSEHRARMVMNYLIQHHIDPARLQAVGAPSPAPENTFQPGTTNEAFRNVTFKAAMGTE
jgi:outer membrane protein OmpA-like peptidoglycan-associated protein